MTRAWVIRGGEENRLVDTFVGAGCTGVGYSTVGDGRSLSKQDVLEAIVAEGSSGTPAWHAGIFENFVHDIAIGDLVVMPDTDRRDVLVGRITGPYRFEPEVPVGEYRHRRSVDWIARLGIDELPFGHGDLYKQRVTMADRTAPDLVAALTQVAEGVGGRPIDDVRRIRRPGPGPDLRRQRATPDLRRCEVCQQMKRPALFDEPGVCRDCG